MALTEIEAQKLPVPVDNTVRDRNKPTWHHASMFGYGVMLLFFGIFGIWAATAPLASGVIASGKLRAESNRKTIQHYGGGLVQEILVQNGDSVAKGQILLRLDPLQINTDSLISKNRYIALVAEKALLVAERDGLEVIQWPEEIDKSDPLAAPILTTMEKLFVSRRDAQKKQIEIQQEKIIQNYMEIESLKEREESVQEQLELIEEELQGVQQMFDKGYARKNRLLALKRMKASLDGQHGQVGATQSRVLQRIHEHELRVEAYKQSKIDQAVERLRTVENRITELRERMLLTRASKERIEIKAPVSGTVVDMVVHTVGAVIGSGRALMDIVPNDDELVVQGKVKPKDIDSVRIGATVKVRLSAFNPRITPPVDGIVISRSADTTTPSRGKPYYSVVIKLDPKSVKKSLGDQHLVSGMPATSIIAVGERTLLAYWMTPLIASFELALREP